jgi:Ras-related protein Rab-11A
MVIVGNGRFCMPDNLFYDKDQHIYLDDEKKIIGIDEIGYHLMKEPSNLVIHNLEQLEIGTHFATLSAKSGEIFLISPCSGKVKAVNTDALKNIENDAYSIGFIIQMETIEKVDPNLITSNDIKNWILKDLRAILGNQFTFKAIIVGETGVGKSSIRRSLDKNYIQDEIKPTTNIDFGSVDIKINYPPNDIDKSDYIAKCNLWEIVTQIPPAERSMYYLGTEGAILVYDLGNKSSFEKLEQWIDEIDENIGLRFPILLLGNKTDLPRAISTDQIAKFSSEFGCLIAECSVKEETGIHEAFELFGEKLLDKKFI